MKIDHDYLASTVQNNSLSLGNGEMSYRVTGEDKYFLIAERNFLNFLEEKGVSPTVQIGLSGQANFEPNILCKISGNYQDCFKLRYRNFITGTNEDPTFLIKAKNEVAEGILLDYYRLFNFAE
jgi:hypothetical protein